MSVLALVLAAVLAESPQDPPPDFWHRDTMLGDPGGVRIAMADHGLTVTLAFTGEVISCTSGGLKRDTGADLLLDCVIDLDFSNSVGWTGATARANPMWLAGDGVTGDVGDLTVASNITGRGGVRVFEAWFQQAFFEDTCSIRAGIVAADQEFAISTAGLLYSNSVFGGPVFLTPNLRWPIYPVGALGARARVNLTKQAYVQAAVYDGDPGTEDFNRSGFRVRLRDAEGLFTIAEAGLTVEDPLPRTIKAGLFRHTADFPKHATGAPGAGLRGGYAVFEQKLSREPVGVDLFARIGFAQEDRAFVSLGADAGVNVTGLIPGRPADVLGLGVIYARVGRSFARSQPDRPLWGHETVFEATYKIQLTPWWSLQPDVQYILHPGGSTAIPNAVVAALRIDLLF